MLFCVLFDVKPILNLVVKFHEKIDEKYWKIYERNLAIIFDLFAIFNISLYILLKIFIIYNYNIKIVKVIALAFFAIVLAAFVIVLSINIIYLFTNTKNLHIDLICGKVQQANNTSTTNCLPVNEINDCHQNNAILKEIYKPDQATEITSLFLLIDKVFLSNNRKRFNKKVSNHLYDLMSKVSSGDRDSLKTTLLNIQRRLNYYETADKIINAIDSKKSSNIEDFDKYHAISLELLNEFNSSLCLKIPDQNHEEFILLCILYFAVIRDQNLNPIIPTEINPVTSKTLKQTLENIIN